MENAGNREPERLSKKERLDEFIKICAKDAFDAVGELLTAEEISRDAADDWLASLGVVANEPFYVRAIASDRKKAKAFATIAVQSQDSHLAHDAIETAERIKERIERDDSLSGVAIILGDTEVTDKIQSPITKELTLEKIVINSADPDQLQLLQEQQRVYAASAMAEAYNDLTFLDHIKDPAARDDKLATFALKKNRVDVAYLVTDLELKAQTLIQLNDQMTMQKKEAGINTALVKEELQKITDLTRRANLYTLYIESFKDTSVIEQLAEIADQIEDAGIKTYFTSYVVRYTGDRTLAEKVKANLKDTTESEKDIIRANVAVGLQDPELVQTIISQELRNVTLTEVLIARSDARLAMEKGNFDVASQIIVQNQDEALAWEFGRHNSELGRSQKLAYAPLITIACQQRNINLLLQTEDPSLRSYLLREYTLTTGEVPEISDESLKLQLSEELAILTQNYDLASRIDSKLAQTIIVASIVESGRELPLKEIATITDPAERITEYIQHIYNLNEQKQDVFEVANMVIPVLRKEIPIGERSLELKNLGVILSSVPLLQEAAYDAMHQSNKESKVESIIDILKKIREVAAHREN